MQGDMIEMSERVPQGYPLRPELMESSYLLYSATRSKVYWQIGRLLQGTLVDHTSAPCGFASLADVATRKLPSFWTVLYCTVPVLLLLSVLLG